MGYHIQKCISESKYGFPVCGEETELKVDSMLIPPLAHKKYKEPASSQDLTSELQASALTPKQMGLPEIRGGKATFQVIFRRSFIDKRFANFSQSQTKSLESTELVPWLEL